MKIRSVGAELFHAKGQTDLTKLTANDKKKELQQIKLFSFNVK